MRVGKFRLLPFEIREKLAQAELADAFHGPVPDGYVPARSDICGHSTVLIGTCILRYALFAARDWLTFGNMLPMLLCNQATVVVLAASFSSNEEAHKLARFFGAPANPRPEDDRVARLRNRNALGTTTDGGCR